jgi:hypothetical protein
MNLSRPIVEIKVNDVTVETSDLAARLGVSVDDAITACPARQSGIISPHG